MVEAPAQPSADGQVVTETSSEARRDTSRPHQRQADDVVAEFGSDVQRGLNDAEVRSRRERYGRNELATEKAIPAWRRFLAQFQDVLVILLLIATGISAGLWAYERDASSTGYAVFAIASSVLWLREIGKLFARLRHYRRHLRIG